MGGAADLAPGIAEGSPCGRPHRHDRSAATAGAWLPPRNATRTAMKSGLVRATLTLLTGSVAAHAIPLVLGPALTRLYSPEDFGQFALLWALATNLAVVGCARYEFALPLESTELRAAQLMALCARILLAVTTASAAAAAVLLLWRGMPMVWALPLAVFAGGAVQWLTLWASRSQRFGLLSAARLMQQGGGAILQLLFGFMKTGPLGLVLGATLASLGAAWMLARPAPAGGWVGLWRQPLATLRSMPQRSAHPGAPGHDGAGRPGLPAGGSAACLGSGHLFHGLWRPMGADRGTGPVHCAVHRRAFHGIAPRGGHHGLGRAGLGAAPGVGWTMPVFCGPAAGPPSGRADRCLMGRVSEHAGLLCLLFLGVGKLEGHPP